MTPQERDLLIAEAMGYIIIDGWFYTRKESSIELLFPVKDWNPSSNPDQREMIKDKLREWGCGYHGGYDDYLHRYYFRVWNYPEPTNSRVKQFDETVYEIFSKLSESEAFLEAVGELCLNLKTK